MTKMAKKFNQISLYGPDQSTKIGVRTLGINPLVHTLFLEGQCFFSKFRRRIEGGKN